MSNDFAECGCEGHYENFNECRYPALRVEVQNAWKAEKAAASERDALKVKLESILPELSAESRDASTYRDSYERMRKVALRLLGSRAGLSAEVKAQRQDLADLELERQKTRAEVELLRDALFAEEGRHDGTSRALSTANGAAAAMREALEAWSRYQALKTQGECSDERLDKLAGDAVYLNWQALGSDAGRELIARMERLEKALVRCSAELRHAYRAKAEGGPADWGLIERAIRIAEEAALATPETEGGGEG